MKNLKIRVNNEIKEFEVEKEYGCVRLSDIAHMVEEDYKGIITLAQIDNKLLELTETVCEDDKEIIFRDTTDNDGRRVYNRSISFIFVIACRDVFNGARVFIEHSISGGIYCTVKIGRDITEEDVEAVKDRMAEIIAEDHNIYPIDMPTELAQREFQKVKRNDKVELLKYRKGYRTRLYKCLGYIDYFYGYMVPSTGYIKDFDVKLFNKGMVIMGPNMGIKGTINEFKPQYKLSKIYNDTEQWSIDQGIYNIPTLNRVIEEKRYGDVIRTTEALHDKKIAEIADEILEKGSRVILIAAPSSSGKTSFAHRLNIHLRVNGLNAVSLSTDNYFIDRDKTPRDENGDYDFEALEAIDLHMLNTDINKLLNGEEIDEVIYNFRTGKKELSGKKFKLEKNQPLIIEGIHSLNPRLTSEIDDSVKFKIYISVITQINLDDHNRIPTTDLRLLRRMVRDYKFRGYDAAHTIDSWPKVRRGEERNIFPYQEQADVMFNSSCMYEISVLKPFALPLLEEISPDDPHYIEVKRLKSLLQYFVELDDTSDITSTSILREFIGGSKIVDE